MKTRRRQAIRTMGLLGLAPWIAGTVRGAEGVVRGGGRIKVGQIGVAHAHASKLSVYRESKDYEVVGLCEADPELRRRAEKQAAFRGVPWMTQEQLLDAPGLQAVLVETEVKDLLRVAEACVARGKHVHIDKPAGESLPHFRRVLDSATRQGLMVQLGYMYRYNPGFVMLREFLANGWLGDVFEIHTVMSKVVGDDDRKRFAQYPGGILFELGGHVMDAVIHVLGKPEEVVSYRQHASAIPDTLLDNMLAVLRYPKALATVKTSAMEVEGFDRRHFVVCGTEGTFHIQPLDAPAVRLSLAKERPGYKRGTQEIALPKYTRYVGDAADMARVVRGEKRFEFTPEHDLAVQTALLQACGVSLDK